MHHKQIIASKWRNYFEESGLNNSSYKLFIETAYGCHADCMGCPIPKILRAESNPKWEIPRLENALNIFADNFNEFNKNKPLANLAITMGPAEHLFFEEDYLKQLGIVAKKCAQKMNAQKFHVTISTSGLFSENKIKDKVLALKEVLGPDELAFAFIANIRKFQKNSKHFYRFAEFLFTHVDLVELEINLDNELEDISENTLKEFGHFVNSFPFVQLDFGYAINNGNQTVVGAKGKDFVDFIKKVRQYSNASFKPYFSMWDQKLNLIEDDFDFNESFNKFFDQTVEKSIRLNALGQWHLSKNVMGNLYIDENFNVSALCKESENPFNSENLLKVKNDIKKYFLKQMAKHMACQDCNYKKLCAESGYLFYSKFTKQDEDSCSNPAYIIFNDKVKNNN